MYKGSNPALKGLRSLSGNNEEGIIIENKATYKGVALKSLFFVGLAILAAIVSTIILYTNLTLAYYVIVASAIGTIVFGVVAAFAPATVKVTGTLYIIFEGILVGAISCILNMEYRGIVLAALLSTFGVFAVMMVLYATGIIKVGHRFRNFMISALIGIIVVNLLIFIISIISRSAGNGAIWNLFYGNNIFSIILSVVMVLFASFFILVDLSDISAMVEGGLDKKYEWRAAYGLALTLIWIYLEFLRLFAKIKSR